MRNRKGRRCMEQRGLDSTARRSTQQYLDMYHTLLAHASLQLSGHRISLMKKISRQASHIMAVTCSLCLNSPFVGGRGREVSAMTWKCSCRMGPSPAAAPFMPNLSSALASEEDYRGQQEENNCLRCSCIKGLFGYTSHR